MALLLGRCLDSVKLREEWKDEFEKKNKKLQGKGKIIRLILFHLNAEIQLKQKLKTKIKSRGAGGCILTCVSGTMGLSSGDVL